MNGGRTIRLGGAGLTPAVKLLLIVNGAVYVFCLLFIHWIGPALGWHEAQSFYAIHHYFALTPEEFAAGKIWQIATYMFLHDVGGLHVSGGGAIVDYVPGSPTHILFNMFVLWMFGTLFEPAWGARRFVFFYVMCGLGGGVAVVLMGLFFPGVAFFQHGVVGASAAVLGFVIAYAVTFPDRYVYFFFMVPIQGRYIGIATVILDLVWNFFGGHIASQAHIGGMLTAYFLLTGNWRPSRWKGLRRELEEQRKQRQRRKAFRDAMRR